MTSRGIPKVSPGYRLTIAYVILAVAMLAGFFRVEMTRYELALETERRAFALCELTDENRVALINLIDNLISTRTGSLDDLEPEVRDYLRELALARQEILGEARDDLDLVECPPNPDEVGF